MVAVKVPKAGTEAEKTATFIGSNGTTEISMMMMISMMDSGTKELNALYIPND